MSARRATDQPDVPLTTALAVLRALRDTTSRHQVAEAVAMSPRRVWSILVRLIEEGWVTASGPAPPRPTVYRLTRRGRCLIG